MREMRAILSNLWKSLTPRKQPLVANEFSDWRLAADAARGEPAFAVGDLVRTVVGRVGDQTVKTDIVARVQQVGWHYERKIWIYFLDIRGRRARRWYVGDQLRAADTASATGRTA